MDEISQFSFLMVNTPEDWLQKQVKFLRQIEQQRRMNDNSRTYQERDDIHLIIEAQVEYAELALKELKAHEQRTNARSNQSPRT